MSCIHICSKYISNTQSVMVKLPMQTLEDFYLLPKGLRSSVALQQMELVSNNFTKAL